MPHPLWQSLAHDAGMKLTEAQLAQLDQYLDLLIEWNEKINLTRIVDRADAEVKHVADALTLLKFLPKALASEKTTPPPSRGRPGGGAERGETIEQTRRSPPPPAPPARGGELKLRTSSISLADVGTGGGVPGVPIAICRPDIKVTLIDSTKKKLDTIQKIVDAMGLTNVTMLHARAETVKTHFDIVTARAVADPDTLLQWTWTMMGPRTALLAMKGPKAKEEIDAASRRLSYLRRSATIEPVDVLELSGHCVVRVR